MIAKKLIGAANYGIVLSKSLKKNLSPFIADEKIETVNNFFEDYLAERIEDVLENKSLEKLKIIYLSNLMMEKGIMDLLSAIELLQKNNINYESIKQKHEQTNEKCSVFLLAAWGCAPFAARSPSLLVCYTRCVFAWRWQGPPL